MKLLSIVVPCYNSQNYMVHAIESLLPGRDQVEIIIVNDGSTDRTADIADDYERRYPGIVRTIHKENGGHGDAVMAGLCTAQGLYFKVVDSDDWVDANVYPKVLKMLEGCSQKEEQIDLLISNYIYDKIGVKHKHVMSYHNTLPENRVFSWEETRHFRLGQYMLMHSVIYRTQLLHDCNLQLPKHTFYVDNLYVYIPLPHVKRMRYLNEIFYHYFIGRTDQSVCEDVMISRIDQVLKVNHMVIGSYDLRTIENAQLRRYMRNYIEIVTTVSSILLIKSGTGESMQKKDELWDYIGTHDPKLYRQLRWRFMGGTVHLRGHIARKFQLGCYRLCNRVFGFS
jgi:glycosyltransferase involved in cell wall biosynthesis